MQTNHRFIICAAAIAFLTHAMPAFALQGRVVDTLGTPVINASVKLCLAGVTDSTDTLGRFLLQSTLSQDYSRPSSLVHPPALRRDMLVLSVGAASSKVMVEVFTANGRSVARLIDAQLSGGEYRVDLASALPRSARNGVYMVRVRIDGQETTMRWLRGGASAHGSAAGPTGRVSHAGLSRQAKIPVTVDTLLVSKPGYLSVRMPLDSISDSLPDITLRPDSVQISPLAVVIDSNVLNRSIQSLAGDSVLIVSYDALSGTQPLDTVATGDVLILPPSLVFPYGALRRVEAVTRGSQEIRLSTTQASLVDVILMGTIDTVVAIEWSDVNSASLRKRTAGGQYTFSSPFSRVLYDADGNEATTNDQISLTGEVAVAPGFQFSMRIRWNGVTPELASLRFVGNVNCTAQLIVGTSVDKGFLDAKYRIPTPPLRPMVFWVGAVPVWITPKLDITLGVKGDASAQISTGASFSTSYEAGIQYDNGAWSPIVSHTEEFSPVGPTLQASAVLQAYINPQLALMIDGLAGPYASATGYAELSAALHSNPWWELDCGLEIMAGAKVEIFDHTLADKSFDLFDWKRPLALAAPRGLRASPGTNRVDLEWDEYAGADSFRVYCASDPSVSKSNYSSLPGSRKITTAGRSLSVDGLTGDAYYFRLTAIDATTGLESFESNVVQATINQGDAVTNLTDISNWDIVSGTAVKQGSQLIVGNYVNGGDKIVTKATFHQPFMMTWYGRFPSTSLSYHTMALSSADGANSISFWTRYQDVGKLGYGVCVNSVALNSLANPLITAINNEISGEFTMICENDSVSLFQNSTQIAKRVFSYRGPMQLSFTCYERPFVLDSVFVWQR